MSSEAGHIQITEFNKEVIPMINWMMEDLFCQYGVSLPWFMCDFDFPDFSQRPDWVSGYNFNLDWGEWGYWLVKFNEMLGLLFDEAHLPRWQMPDLSPGSWAFFNDYTEILYDNMQRHYVYSQSGTFIKDEVIEGETSGITGWYKWIDGDGYIHVANKQDASGESVADFEEEKIVGADSGAYAFTSEAAWESPLSIYNYDSGGPIIKKVARNFVGFDESWEQYETEEVVGGEGVMGSYALGWGTSYAHLYGWNSGGTEFCFRFDTTDAPTGATSIILRARVTTITDTFGTPTLKLYKLNEPLSTSHWLTGGTFVAEKEISTIGYHDIELSSGDINYGGMTRFKCTLPIMQSETKPESVMGQGITYLTPMSSYTRLIFTR